MYRIGLIGSNKNDLLAVLKNFQLALEKMEENIEDIEYISHPITKLIFREVQSNKFYEILIPEDMADENITHKIVIFTSDQFKLYKDLVQEVYEDHTLIFGGNAYYDKLNKINYDPLLEPFGGMKKFKDQIEIDIIFINFEINLEHTLSEFARYFYNQDIFVKNSFILSTEEVQENFLLSFKKRYSIKDAKISIENLTQEERERIFKVYEWKIKDFYEIITEIIQQKHDPLITFIKNTNWNIMEYNNIFSKKRAIELRDNFEGISISDIDDQTKINIISEVLKNIVEYLYQKHSLFDSYKRLLPFREKIVALDKIGAFPQYISLMINSLLEYESYLESMEEEYYNYLDSLNDNSDDNDNNSDDNSELKFSRDSIILNFTEVLGWFYKNHLLKNLPISIEEKIKKREMEKSKKFEEIYIHESREIDYFRFYKLGLKSFEVKGLYEKFDYSLNCENNEGITIIYGPNGSGKTTMLEIISDFSKGEIANILKIDFRELIFTLVNINSFKAPTDIIIKIIKESEGSFKIIIIFREIETIINFDKFTSNDFVKFLFSLLKNINDEYFNEILIQSIKVYYPNQFQFISSNIEAIELLFKIITNFKCYYIPAVRLEININDLYRFINKQDRLASELSRGSLENIKKELLDNVINYKAKQFLKDFNSLNASQRDLFFSILNQDIFFDKMITYSELEGFQITLNDVEEKIIPLSALSSGEKNILIILYDCILSNKDFSLILIDEPEISLHIDWQIKFLKILFKIKESNIKHMADTRFILSTHSPQIIHNRRDLSIKLKRSEMN